MDERRYRSNIETTVNNPKFPIMSRNPDRHFRTINSDKHFALAANEVGALKGKTPMAITITNHEVRNSYRYVGAASIPNSEYNTPSVIPFIFFSYSY